MAKIPTILEAGRADGKLATSNSIFDENKGMFQSEINDIQDTLNSDNPNKPLSAKQGKVLKELLDAKVIETGAVPIDSEPIKGNTTHVVNSDGLAKEFNKCNTTIINTDRIENGAVTTEKIATSAFDSTLSVSGKIAPANVVGTKLNELGKQVIYDITANNDGTTFASLSALLSSENLSTLIPYAVRCGGMSIRFVQSSSNKYIQARCMAQNFTTDVTQWQGVDEEPVADSKNLVESGGVALQFKKQQESINEIEPIKQILTSTINIFDKSKIVITNKKLRINSSSTIAQGIYPLNNIYLGNCLSTDNIKGKFFFSGTYSSFGIAEMQLYSTDEEIEIGTIVNRKYFKSSTKASSDITGATKYYLNIEFTDEQYNNEQNIKDILDSLVITANNAFPSEYIPFNSYVEVKENNLSQELQDKINNKANNSELGTDNGVLCNGTYIKGTILFDSYDVNIGDTIIIERSDGTNYVTFYNSSNEELYHNTKKYEETTIPVGFSYAKLDYSTGSSTYKVTDVSSIRYRIKQLEDKSAKIDEIEEKLDSKAGEIGTDNGVLCNGTFNKYATLFTATDVMVGDRIIIKQTGGDNAVTFYDKENQELYHSVPGSTALQETTIPPEFAVAKVDYGAQPQSTFIITDTSQVKYRIQQLENSNSEIVGENDYGVISAKIELPFDVHDENGLCEIMSVKSSADDNVALKFILKKALTSVFDTAVGICPVPKYNAGILAGYAINKVIWYSGKSLSWQSGFIVNDDTGKCSNKLLVTFNSITVNTNETDVRICWYFDETTSNIEWTRYTTALVNKTINAPSGAKYFAISTKLTDTNASVVFDTYAFEGGFISPDGWNKNLLLGTDTIALRFTGDVTNSANQDIRLKIDDSAVTIYHGTNNSVIHTFSKTSYPDAESLYAALNELTDFSVEMLDVCGVVFDDFIKGDVALVAQYSIKKQSDPSTFVTEWDAFPFYFTTKEKKGIYNFEFGIDSSDTNGKKVQAVLNGYPLFSTSELHNLVGNPLEITYGEDIVVHNHNFNLQGDFYCPIRRMFYVEGMVEGNVNGTGGAAATCSAKIEEAFDIMLRNGGKNIGYEDLMKEVIGDYKTSRAQFTFTSDDNGFPLYENVTIRNMFVRKGVTPSTFFMLNNSNISSRLSIIKACLMAGYYCGIHSPYEYSADINIGSMKYSELVDAVSKSFAKFVELFDRQPLVWDFHRDAESYNTVRYLMNHGFKFIMGGGYGRDYGIVSTITRYRIQRFGIRPDTNGQNVRMPNDWLFKKY